MANNKVRFERERGPISELVRLIAQAHREGYAEPPEFPPAPQLQVGEDTPERTSELDEHQVYEAGQVDDQSYIADHEHKPSRVRGPKVAVAIFSLVLAGTAGALGYRAMTSGALAPALPPIIKASNQPIKVVPASNEAHATNGANANQVDPEITGSIEKVVSREEQPVRIQQPKQALRAVSTVPVTSRGPLSQVGGPAAAAAPPRAVPPGRVAAGADLGPEPAAAIVAGRAGQSGASDIAAASSRAAVRTTEVTPAILGGGYAVQVGSERTEKDAQAAFRVLQAKYPDQLGGRQAIIRRADLGGAGTYYRALVGPLSSAGEARSLCSRLKVAGADCIIQKN